MLGCAFFSSDTYAALVCHDTNQYLWLQESTMRHGWLHARRVKMHHELRRQIEILRKACLPMTMRRAGTEIDRSGDALQCVQPPFWYFHLCVTALAPTLRREDFSPPLFLTRTMITMLFRRSRLDKFFSVQGDYIPSVVDEI